MSNEPDQVWTVLSMLEWGTGFFEKKGIDSPRMSIEWLIAHILEIKRLDIYLQYDRPLSKSELTKLRPLIKRRAAHEPLQHITGSTDFMGIPIRVNSNVLIPRTETEQLVEIILDSTSHTKDRKMNLLDVGTGSGCIPIALKKYRPLWVCAGLDISEKAIETATLNAEINSIEIDFYPGDLNQLDSNPVTSEINWDIIVSNPPYITFDEKESLDPQVKNYEPELALFHKHPLKLYEKISSFASRNESLLYLECNDKFIADVADVVSAYYNSPEILKDYDGNKRFIVAKNLSK